MSLVGVISRITTWKYALIVEALMSFVGLQLSNIAYTVCGLMIVGPEV